MRTFFPRSCCLFISLAALFPFLSVLSGCGGGAASNLPTTPAAEPPAMNMRSGLFAPVAQADAAADSTTLFLKACYFPEQKFGAFEQAGINFLESMVLEILPASTAPIYHAQTGARMNNTNRTYRGSSPATGAPPRLWTGVLQINTDGSASGFGAPCTPTDMLEAPSNTCYWLGQNLAAESVANGSFLFRSDNRPQTSSGSASLINPGSAMGTAYYFYYEMSFNPNCSAPGSKIVFRGPPRTAR